jgi:hypothetical protein
VAFDRAARCTLGYQQSLFNSGPTFSGSGGETLKSSLVIPLLLGVASNLPIAVAQSPGTFTATGNMATVRAFHTATLLANGKSLDRRRLSGRQLRTLRPFNGTFTATGRMTTPRGIHKATLLADGRVLITGGSRDQPLSAELYDPSTGTFAATDDMIAPPSGWPWAAALLGNGKVLIAGSGFGAQLYDPATGTFAATSLSGTTGQDT